MTPSDPHQPDPLTTHIDRTLHALAHPQSPTGLDRRILATLAAHQATTPAPTRPFTLRYPLTFAAAAVLLLLLATHRLIPHKAGAPSMTVSPSWVGPPRTPPTPGAPSMTASSSWVGEATPSITPMPVSSSRAGSHQPIHLKATLTTTNPNQQALADLHTPSFPAPPLPPTPQERLVRLMLRRGEIHDLAQLNPAQLAAAAHDEQAAFHAFFEPPLPLPEPPPSTTPQSPGDSK